MGTTRSASHTPTDSGTSTRRLGNRPRPETEPTAASALSGVALGTPGHIVIPRIFEGTSTSAAVELKASRHGASQDAVSHPFNQFGDGF